MDSSLGSFQADTIRLEKYYGAIERAVAKAKARNPFREAHVIDVGSGGGILSMMAARAGATSVLASEFSEALCNASRVACASNALSEKISIINRDACLLERGKGVRHSGLNVCVLDIFEAGLLGDNVMTIIDHIKRNILQPDCIVVPAAATVYAMGVECITSKVSFNNVDKS